MRLVFQRESQTGFGDRSPCPCTEGELFAHWAELLTASMGPRSPQWVNTPVLMQALERYEQGNLPRSMQLWIQQLLEIEAPSKAPLRKHSS